MTSLAQEIVAKLVAMPPVERHAYFASLDPQDAEAMLYDWKVWARPDQLPPEGDWRQWVMLSGRRSGKTRSGAEFVKAEVLEGRAKRILLAAPTQNDGRVIMIEGPSGILACSPPWAMPIYHMAIGKLEWPSGAEAFLISSEVPSRARGHGFDLAWCDELCYWENGDALWKQVQLTTSLRGPKGHEPRIVISTTPPSLESVKISGMSLKASLKLVKKILALPGTVRTHATTDDNAHNLAPAALAALHEEHDNTTFGRVELGGELLEDIEGAAFTRELLEGTRVASAPDELARIVVGVDPSGTRRGDIAGIVVAGKSAEGHYFILQDSSLNASPEGWASKAVACFDAWQANWIIAESNFGAEMVESTIRNVRATVPVKLVHASRGKMVRAEPVVQLFEQGKAHIVGNMLALEDECCSFLPGANMTSPGRMDAMVWALTWLSEEKPESPWARQQREHNERMASDPAYRRDWLRSQQINLFAR